MSDRERWNERYAQGAYADRTHPSAIVEHCVANFVQPEGEPKRALDVACGLGRNASYFGRCGYKAEGWDVSDVAIEQARARDPSVDWLCVDLLNSPLPAGTWHLITMVRFVALDVLQALCERLSNNGLLVVEQHLKWPQPVAGPGSERFRVAPGELVRVVSAAGLEILHAHDGLLEDPDGVTMAISQVIGKRVAE